MKKYLKTCLKLISLLTILLFNSCNDKTGSPFAEGDNNNNSSSNANPTKEYTPSNIYYKAIILDGGSVKISGFTSGGSCSVTGGIYPLSGTPSYNYSKTTSSVAAFMWHYTEVSGSGSYRTYYDYVQKVTLTFSSSTSGTYKGTMTLKTSGSMSTTNYGSISGKFTID